MTKTMKDIREAGGKCEKVATDFWECTDSDGQVWWCSDGGKACVEKPKADAGCDCGADDGRQNPRAEAVEFARVDAMAVNTLAILPHPEDPGGEIEIAYRTQRGRGPVAAAVKCEVCITVTSSNGVRTTKCQEVTCPSGIIAAPGGGGQQA